MATTEQPDVERRIITLRPLQLVKRDIQPVTDDGAVVSDSDVPTTSVQGYAAVYRSASEDLGGFVEFVQPGAFKRALADPATDVRALLNHDSNLLLGRQRSGTLELDDDDEEGLGYRFLPPDTQVGRDTLELIKRGDITGSSFTFRVRKDSWNWDTDPVQRFLHDVDIFDVGPVTYPAYQRTSCEVSERCLHLVQEHRSYATSPRKRRLWAQLRLVEIF